MVLIRSQLCQVGFSALRYGPVCVYTCIRSTKFARSPLRLAWIERTASWVIARPRPDDRVAVQLATPAVWADVCVQRRLEELARRPVHAIKTADPVARAATDAHIGSYFKHVSPAGEPHRRPRSELESLLLVEHLV